MAYQCFFTVASPSPPTGLAEKHRASFPRICERNHCDSVSCVGLREKRKEIKYFSFFSKWPWIQSSSHLIRRTCWFTQVPPSRFTPSNSVWGNRNETPWLARSHASLRAAVSRHRPPYRARALISAHRWYKPTSGNKAIYLIYFYIGWFFLIWWI